jgi:hypothetical protein
MSQTPERLRKAVERNLAELSNCILKRRAYNALIAVGSAHALDFFRISGHALQNDLISHALRVFDRHKDAASFWYIRRQLETQVSKEARNASVSLENIEATAARLNHIRDKAHFHLDKAAVERPASVWDAAGISGDEFIALTEGTHEILRRLYIGLAGVDLPVPDYQGEDVGKIIRAYVSVHPDAPIAI